jgi:hypothetical protein
MDNVAQGGINLDRVNEAVKRILGVKCVMGLIDGLEGCPSRDDYTGYDLASA